MSVHKSSEMTSEPSFPKKDPSHLSRDRDCCLSVELSTHLRSGEILRVFWGRRHRAQHPSDEEFRRVECGANRRSVFVSRS